MSQPKLYSVSSSPSGNPTGSTYTQGTQFGGGGGDGGMDMMDAKISAAEARVDTKFEQLRGDLKDFATKSTVWGAAATIIAVVLAAIAFGGDRFDAGMGLADKQAVQIERDAKQDQDVAGINQKLDKLIEQSQKK